MRGSSGLQRVAEPMSGHFSARTRQSTRSVGLAPAVYRGVHPYLTLCLDRSGLLKQ